MQSCIGVASECSDQFFLKKQTKVRSQQLKTASPAVFELWFSPGMEGKCQGRDLRSLLRTMGSRWFRVPFYPKTTRHQPRDET